MGMENIFWVTEALEVTFQLRCQNNLTAGVHPAASRRTPLQKKNTVHCNLTPRSLRHGERAGRAVPVVLQPRYPGPDPSFNPLIADRWQLRGLFFTRSTLYPREPTTLHT